ncbi:PREDICTED: uncharacterized protein LOC104783513 [Camelina sativa]|uniref:Uncharacterized protein LOC104783513 n=1 Tax=Camelina sativa TaxID=90675 RepID=A0ABM0YWM7_CAMSA|nr:PREDICTED: uncharacterized protein LOC104783513 [Camelina sativa]
MSNWSSDQEVDEIVEEVVDSIVEEIQYNYTHPEIPPTPIIRRVHINRDREEGHTRLWNDYFSENPTYTNAIQRRDATGRLGLSALQKCTPAIRMMAYGCLVDAVDEYLRLAETTAHKCLLHFVEGVINLFGDEYLKRPTAEDLQRLLNIGEHRGFPEMVGSIDCMHWEWKNCPTAWKGQYSRGSGSLNDINVLDRSPVFDDILEGRAPRVTYVVNGRQYNMVYYLTDGIYPKWATFIQSITLPRGRKAKLFAEWQEGCRKDVERATNDKVLWEEAKSFYSAALDPLPVEVRDPSPWCQGGYHGVNGSTKSTTEPFSPTFGASDLDLGDGIPAGEGCRLSTF